MNRPCSSSQGMASAEHLSVLTQPPAGWRQPATSWSCLPRTTIGGCCSTTRPSQPAPLPAWWPPKPCTLQCSPPPPRSTAPATSAPPLTLRSRRRGHPRSSPEAPSSTPSARPPRRTWTGPGPSSWRPLPPRPGPPWSRQAPAASRCCLAGVWRCLCRRVALRGSALSSCARGRWVPRTMWPWRRRSTPSL